MFLPIDPSSGLPIYRQIMDQVRRMAASGTLAPGERVPSVRELAAVLEINYLTVAKAYGELEREGVLVKRRGLGMFVARPPAGAAAVVPLDLAGLRATAQRLTVEARQAGLDREATAELLDECWEDIVGDRAEGAGG